MSRREESTNNACAAEAPGQQGQAPGRQGQWHLADKDKHLADKDKLVEKCENENHLV